MNVNGKGSWFGGTGDPTDSGHTANGETTKTPGIAVYNHGTLNGYWRVTAPNGKTVVLRQTDIGPAPWTGRKIDVTYSALGRFGYGEHNFPTDSQFKAEYLGGNPPKGVQRLAQASTPASVPRPAGVPPVQVPTENFDKPGFEKAQKAAVLGKLLASEKGSKENPLFATGLVSTKAPSRSEYVTEGTRTLPGTPSPPQAPGRVPAGPSGGSKLGGFLPGNAKLEWGRVDEGQDVKTNPGGPVLAPGDGVVVAVKSDPSGFGPDYPIVKITSGPLAGTSWYLGHVDSALKAGQQFRHGQTIARTSKTGHNAPPGWLEAGLANTLGQGNRGQGAAAAKYLRGGR